MTTQFDYDAVRHQLVTAAAELKSNGHDVRAILEDCGVFRKINKYRELSVDGLLKDYYLKDDIQEIDTPTYVTKWGAPATCRGNIYKRGVDGKPDRLIRGAWNGALTYRICTVTGTNQSGERVQRGIQYHTVAFALANGRWPRLNGICSPFTVPGSSVQTSGTEVLARVFLVKVNEIQVISRPPTTSLRQS